MNSTRWNDPVPQHPSESTGRAWRDANAADYSACATRGTFFKGIMAKVVHPRPITLRSVLKRENRGKGERILREFQSVSKASRQTFQVTLIAIIDSMFFFFLLFLLRFVLIRLRIHLCDFARPGFDLVIFGYPDLRYSCSCLHYGAGIAAPAGKTSSVGFPVTVALLAFTALQHPEMLSYRSALKIGEKHRTKRRQSIHDRWFTIA